MTIVIPTYAQLVELCKQPSDHSPIGFSGTYRWWECSASVGLIATMDPLIRNRGSAASFDGTVGHAVGAVRAQHGVWPEGTPEDLKADLQVYIDTLNYYIDQAMGHEEPAHVGIEERFELPEVHKLSRGTTDGVVWDPWRRVIVIIDLKLGQQWVSAGTVDDPNKQLLGYGLAVLIRRRYPAVAIELVIVQPRIEGARPVRSVIIPMERVAPFAYELAKHAAATGRPDATFKPGEWCQFCDAAPICDAYAHQRDADALVAFAPVHTLDVERIAAAKRFVDRFRAWAGAVDRAVYALAINGIQIPTYKVTESEGHRKVKSEGVTKTTLELEYNVPTEKLYTKKLKSPAQLEKLVPAKERPKLADLWSKSKSFKLVPESAPGEPVLKLPETAFNDIDDSEIDEFKE